MGDIIILSMFCFIGYAWIKGMGWLLGYGLESRRKSWSSEQWMRKYPEYNEYFK